MASRRKYSAAPARPIAYVNVPFDQWRAEELNRDNLPDHLAEHVLTMAASAPPIDMIVSRATSKHPSQGRRRALVTLGHGTGVVP